MKIVQMMAIPYGGGYYYEDISRLQEVSVPVEERYFHPAKNPLMKKVREPAEVIGIGIRVEPSRWLWGDAVGVSFASPTGREPLLRANDWLERLAQCFPSFTGMDLSSYKSGWEKWAPTVGKFPKAIQYGLSQALLSAVAESNSETMAETVDREWKLNSSFSEVPLHGSCGHERYHGALKQMIHGLVSFPAGQGDDIDGQIGRDGGKLVDYARWWKKAVDRLSKNYRPTLHLDVHGALGTIFAGDTSKVANCIKQIHDAVPGHMLRIESPVVMSSLDGQLKALHHLRSALPKEIHLVVDEWANNRADIERFAAEGSCNMIHIKAPNLGPIQETVESVVTCQRKGIQSLLGGSCIETEISARCSVHLALATQPTLMMAKPGMGVDEAIMICGNEMKRTRAQIQART